MIQKLLKKTTDTTEFLVDFTPYLGQDTLDSVDSINADLSISGETVLSVARTIGNDQIKNLFTRTQYTLPITVAEGKGVLFTASGGSNFTENKITITTTTVGGIEIVVNVYLVVANLTYDSIDGIYSNPLQYYGSVSLASEYFALSPNGEEWDCLKPNVQMGSLIQATRKIDCLNFLGYKTDPAQKLQFPRTDWTLSPNPNLDYIIPDDIAYAVYEEALLIGQGDTDENPDFSIIAEGLGSAKVSYGQSFIQDRILAGISSAMAWNYLRPYLRDSKELTLSRVN